MHETTAPATRIWPARTPWLMTDIYRMTVPYRCQRPHGCWPPNWHLFLTLAGRGQFRQPGMRMDLGPREVLLLSPECHHDYGCIPGVRWEFIWAHFQPLPQWQALMALPSVGDGLRHLRIESHPLFDRLLAAFLRCHGYRQDITLGAVADALALNALEEVLLLITHEQGRQGVGVALSDPVRRVIDHLAVHFAQPQGVPGLARLAGLSPSRLAAVFRQQTGDSIIAYVIKLRLREAARRLAFDGAAVHETATRVGFPSPFYFSRQFRRHYGISPLEYRRRARARIG